MMNFILNVDPAYLSKLVAISCLAGFVQALTPDRWLPLSIVAWKQRWSLGSIVLRTSLLLTVHVFLGVLLFLLLAPLFGGISGKIFWVAAVTIVLGMALLRYFRFERIRLILQSTSESRWTTLQAFLLMGFAEGLLPILMKLSNDLEPRLWIVVSTGYLVGTLVAGTGATLVSWMRLERPSWIPEALDLAHEVGALLPVMASVLVIALF